MNSLKQFITQGVLSAVLLASPFLEASDFNTGRFTVAEATLEGEGLAPTDVAFRVDIGYPYNYYGYYPYYYDYYYPYYYYDYYSYPYWDGGYDWGGRWGGGHHWEGHGHPGGGHHGGGHGGGGHHH